MPKSAIITAKGDNLMAKKVVPDLSGYLVRLRQRMDDLPLAFFSNRDEAVRFALNTPQNPSAEICRTYDDIVSETLSVDIVEFFHGLPARYDIIKSFEDKND